ncbi:hypothetical protein [Oscillibacter sp.]|uniref:hypothetical protein n=1 Tax=Oscillibacter sp. TaxID=1945593 RepID=UPI0028997676|nr:hypothetical protein [Oscillibacter sp.]
MATALNLRKNLAIMSQGKHFGLFSPTNAFVGQDVPESVLTRFMTLGNTARYFSKTYTGAFLTEWLILLHKAAQILGALLVRLHDAYTANIRNAAFLRL